MNDMQIANPKPALQSNFDALPDSAFLRASQLVNDPKRPGAAVPLPFSMPTLWRKVRCGTFPKPHKLSERVTGWKVGEIREWMRERTATQVHHEVTGVA